MIKDNAYTQVTEINGIKYVVDSVFNNSETTKSLESCISKILEKEFLCLTSVEKRVTMTDEFAYSTVQKEVKVNAVE